MCVTATLSPVAGQNEQALSIVDVPRARPITDEFFRLPIDESLGQAIDKSISDLKSPHYATRSKAVEDLVQVGTPALARLRRAYRANGDLEVKLAIGDVVRRAYFNHHVFDRNGFLGISMRAYSFDQRKSEHDRALRAVKTRRPVKEPLTVPPLLPDHIVGVEVRKLTPDTAATRAGLEVYDVIFEVDGKRFSAEANTLNVLSAAIRSIEYVVIEVCLTHDLLDDQPKLEVFRCMKAPAKLTQRLKTDRIEPHTRHFSFFIKRRA